MGPFKPPYVSYEIPQAGQMGYHKRTEFNKLIMKISNKPEDINPSSGFPGYGIIKNGYVLIRGSVAGPKKRLIRMRVSVRKTSKTDIVQLSYVSKEPQN
jgi:large subunit ribosomal protein L3